jgi:xylulokinase
VWHTIGVDVGTSGTRALVIDANGAIVGTGTATYSSKNSKPNWAEQNPEVWWTSTCDAIHQALSYAGIAAADVASVGIAGQMHSSVFLDAAGEVVRPAILWCDQRTDQECDEITSAIGEARLLDITCNQAITGFTAPKILWLQKHEPKKFDRVRKVLLPKDYVRFRMSGEYATDMSDASGTLLFDVRNRKWAHEAIESLGLDSDWFPPSYESPEVIATVSAIGAKETGLAEGTPIVAGAGDQAATAIGVGVVEPGILLCTIGTSGVIFAHMDSPISQPDGRLHMFCHGVPGKWHVMGVTLAAGGAFRWYRNTFCADEEREARERGVDIYDLIVEGASSAPAGAEGLVFLPYLAGERTPYPDPNASGVFFGISFRHSKEHFARAVMEGVTMSLLDCLDLVRSLGVPVTQVRASGGGARSLLWRQMQSNAFGVPVSTVNSTDGAAFGAAILALVGAGVYANVESACREIIRVTDTIQPDTESQGIWDGLHSLYSGLYPNLRDSFDRRASLLRAYAHDGGGRN